MSPDHKYLYHFGIIDSLTRFTFKKSLEYKLKKYFTFQRNFSCVPPDQYAPRFTRFMQEITKTPEERDFKGKKSKKKSKGK